MKKKIKKFTCSVCRSTFPVRTEGGTGYATKANGRAKICYACMADVDKKTMQIHGNSRRLPLYLEGDKVTNWPGTLSFKVLGRSSGRHNMAGTRDDVWFRGPDGFIWHGTRYGEFTNICHCKRTRRTEL